MPTKMKRRYGPRQHERAAKLVEANKRLAYAFVMRVLRIPYDNPLFDDAVQEALWVLWRCALGFDPKRGNAFSTYAYGSMCRMARRFWRSFDRHGFARVGERHIDPPDTLEGLHESIAAGEDDTDAEGLEALRQAIEGLDCRRRAIIKGRLDGRTLRSIGADLDLSKERVRQLEAAAVAGLRQKLRGLADCRAACPATPATGIRLRRGAQPLA